MWRTNRQIGFTIVELLIVVVVIAILAAITIVAYSGIRDRADSSAVASTLSQMTQKIKAYAITNADTYPATLEDIDIVDDSSFYYSANNTSSQKSFCLVMESRDTTYFVTRRSSQPTEGTCEGLVAWWPLNGSPNDAVGGLASATIAGGPTAVNGQDGNTESAYEFTSNGDRLVLPTGWGEGINFGEISGSAWVKRNSLGGTQGIIWSGSGAFHWELLNNVWRVRISGIDRTGLFTNNTIGQWSHVAFTHNRATNAFAFYVDGEQVDVSSGNSNTNTLFTPTSGDIGGSLNNSRQWYGSLDDVRIYNRALSTSDVTELYRLGAQ